MQATTSSFHVIGYDAEHAAVVGCGGVEHLDGAVGQERHLCKGFKLWRAL